MLLGTHGWKSTPLLFFKAGAKSVEYSHTKRDAIGGGHPCNTWKQSGMRPDLAWKAKGHASASLGERASVREILLRSQIFYNSVRAFLKGKGFKSGGGS